MKIALRLFCVAAFCACVTALSLQGAGPGQETLSADLQRLDALAHAFAKTQAHGDLFGEAFWRASKRLTDGRGPVIIDAVMVLSSKWQNEDGLLYWPLVALLPRDEALKVLHHYQHSKRESEKLWAGEYIIEFDMEDTKDAVAKYPAKR